MANIVFQAISLLVLYSIALFYGWLVCLGVLWQFCRSGFALFKKTCRTEVPACLNDPDLGDHVYLTTKSGHKFHYVVKGDPGKPLMLCLHGFPEFWFSWRFQLKEFCDDYRVVAPDLRGYGESYQPKKISDYGVQLLTQDVKEIVEALGYSSCLLVAHDWGGVVAWSVAHRYPEIVDRLIIMNAPHPVIFRRQLRSSWKQFRMSWYIFFHQLPYLPEWVYSLNDYALVDKAFVGEAFTAEVKEAFKHAMSKPGVLTAGINYYRSGSLMTSNSADKEQWKRAFKRKITVPTLVVWGEKDLALDINLLNGLEEFVENLCVKVVKEATHWVQVDKHAVVNGHLRDFLNGPQSQ